MSPCIWLEMLQGSPIPRKYVKGKVLECIACSSFEMKKKLVWLISFTFDMRQLQ